MDKKSVKVLFWSSNIIFYISLCWMIYMDYIKYNDYLWAVAFGWMVISLIVSLMTDVYINLGYKIDLKAVQRSAGIKLIILTFFLGFWSYLSPKQESIILIISFLLLLIDYYMLRICYKDLCELNIEMSAVIKKIANLDLKEKKTLYDLTIQSFIVSVLYISFPKNIFSTNILAALIFFIFEARIIKNMQIEFKKIYPKSLREINSLLIWVSINILIILALSILGIKDFFSTLVMGFNWMIVSDNINPKKSSLKFINIISK